MSGVVVRDAESGAEFEARARVVVNAAGPFCDEVRRMADPATPPLLAASRGSHVVLDRSFLPGEARAPHSRDAGWASAVRDSLARAHARRHHRRRDPSRSGGAASKRGGDRLHPGNGRAVSRPQAPARDVLSTFAGVRPLVRGGGGSTAKLSRDLRPPRRCAGAHHDHRREVDDLSQHGRGVRRSCREAGRPAAAALRDSKPAHPRPCTRCRGSAGGVRLGRSSRCDG